jgi:hypothetical protein
MATADQQKDIYERMLFDSRAKIATAFPKNGLDPNKVIYPESGWRVKDLLAHLAAWEAEVTTSIRAYIDGKEYTIPGFSSDDAYNEQVFRRDYDKTLDQIMSSWGTVQAELVVAIRDIPAEKFDGQIMCPWKLYSDVGGIVRDMVNHEAEHLRDILNRGD